MRISVEAATMNATIEQICGASQVRYAQDGTRKHGMSPVTIETGALLYDFVRAVRPDKTLETGMGYGISTLFICQAHRDNGAGNHTAIDPFEGKAFESMGLRNVEQANLKDLLRFYHAPADDVLPRLCAQEERFDFAFIDGNHLFDYALVDFFYIDKLLNVGGHVAFDDLWMAGVRKVASFVLRNRSYELVRPPSTRSAPAWKRMLRAGRRILQNPLGRDRALKLVPQNVAFLKKLADDSRDWNYHRAF